MAIVYNFPIIYIILCAGIYFSLLPSYSSLSMDYASLGLLLCVLHASFHEMGITNFLASHIPYAILLCAYKLLTTEHKQWFRSSAVIRWTLFLNFGISLLAMYGPVWTNYKETGVVDFTSRAFPIVDRESWDYIVLSSLRSEISYEIRTVLVACYFVACSTVIRCDSIHISKATLICLILFMASNVAYLFVDPLVLVEFYHRIKCNQLYFIVPALYTISGPQKAQKYKQRNL